MIGVFLIILVIHLPLVLNDFHTDDFMVLEIVRSGISSAGLKWMENPANFRPLVNLVLYIRYWVFGDRAGLWYLLNIILHLIATGLLYKVTERLSDKSTAVLAALFFGVYFQHFEAVLWLYGIVRLLAGIFVLLTLYHYHESMVKFKRRNILSSYLFFGLGLFCVEDVVCLTIFLLIGICLFEEPEFRRRLRYGIGLAGITALYLVVRSLFDIGGGSAGAYFGFGKHVIGNVIAYPGWLLFPSLDHPYIVPLMESYLPWILPYLKPASLSVSAIAFAIMIYILIKGDITQRRILVFTLISLIPAIFFNRKISTKLSYIPSMGVAILAATILKSLLGKAGKVVRKSIYIILVVYFTGQAAATILTINYYRATQATAKSMLDSLDRLQIDWTRYEYMLFANVPGRVRLGSAFHYRHGYAPRLIEDSEQAEDRPDIEAEKKRLKDAGISFIEVDFSKNQPMIVETNIK